MADLSTVDASFETFLRDCGMSVPVVGAGVIGSQTVAIEREADVAHEDVAHERSGPSSSQAALSHLDPSIRTTYRLAYMWVKQASATRQPVDWTRIYFDELFSTAPTALEDRLRAHFDALFARLSTEALTPSVGQGSAAYALPRAPTVTPPGRVPVHPSAPLPPSPSPSRTGAASGYDSSTSYRPSSRVSAVSSSSSAGTLGSPDASTVGGALYDFSDGGCGLIGSNPSPTRPVGHLPTVSGPSSTRGDASVRLGQEHQHQPALSKSARAANRSGHIPTLPSWRYVGLYRWSGQLSDGKALTFDEVSVLVKAHAGSGGRAATGSRGAKERPSDRASMKYPFLRERWHCELCGNFYHQEVGQTTNLTKHRKRCSTSRAILGRNGAA